MTLGPGRYDEETTRIREENDAEGVILVVIGGKKGAGFSVQAPADVQFMLPSILKSIANEIERDLRSMM